MSLVPWPALLGSNTHPLLMELSMLLSDRFPESVRGVGLVQSRLPGHWLFPLIVEFDSPHTISSSSSPPTHEDKAHAHKDRTQRQNTKTQHKDTIHRQNTEAHTRSATSLASGKQPPDLQCQRFNYGSTPRDNLEYKRVDAMVLEPQRKRKEKNKRGRKALDAIPHHSLPPRPHQ